MTWHISESLRCLLVQGAESSAAHCLDGEQSAPSKSSPTAAKSSCGGRTKGTSTRSQYGTTCERLTELSGAGEWMSSLEDFPARTLALPAKATDSTANEVGSGEKWPVSLAKYDPDSRSWKIARHLFGEDLTRSSETWPRWGMTVGGELYPLPTLVRPICENGSGYWPTATASQARSEGMIKQMRAKVDAGILTEAEAEAMIEGSLRPARMERWPTPRRQMANGSGPSRVGHREDLQTMVQRFPTPQASDHRDRGNLSTPAVQRRMEIGKQVSLSMSVSKESGRLNPTWVEWLMGWPIGWTALEPLEMGKLAEWQQQHGAFLEGRDSL